MKSVLTLVLALAAETAALLQAPAPVMARPALLRSRPLRMCDAKEPEAPRDAAGEVDSEYKLQLSEELFMKESEAESSPGKGFADIDWFAGSNKFLIPLFLLSLIPYALPREVLPDAILGFYAR